VRLAVERGHDVYSAYRDHEPPAGKIMRVDIAKRDEVVRAVEKARPLTYSGPKQLIPVANKPISQYVLEDLINAGINEIAIVLGETFPGLVREYYGDGSRFGVAEFKDEGLVRLLRSLRCRRVGMHWLVCIF